MTPARDPKQQGLKSSSGLGHLGRYLGEASGGDIWERHLGEVFGRYLGEASVEEAKLYYDEQESFKCRRYPTRPPYHTNTRKTNNITHNFKAPEPK